MYALQIGCKHVEMGCARLLGQAGVGTEGRDGLAGESRSKQERLRYETQAE